MSRIQNVELLRASEVLEGLRTRKKMTTTSSSWWQKIKRGVILYKKN
jgi:hypothetical protein